MEARAGSDGAEGGGRWSVDAVGAGPRCAGEQAGEAQRSVPTCSEQPLETGLAKRGHRHYSFRLEDVVWKRQNLSCSEHGPKAQRSRWKLSVAGTQGYYYTVTGGSSVGFARSRDLKTWEPYHVAMSQQANLTDRGEYQIAPYAPRPALHVQPKMRPRS